MSLNNPNESIFANFGQSFLWIGSGMLKETQISRFYFNRDHAVKLQRKYAKINIFHILNHKSITN